MTSIHTICKTEAKPNERIRYMLDSCVLRRMIENPNYLTACYTKLDLKNSDVFVCDQVIYELQMQNISIEEISEKITAQLGLPFNIQSSESTTQEYIHAIELINKFSPILHWPDNLVLASAIENKTILLSCDKSLIKVATRCDHNCVNPDLIGRMEILS